MKWNENKKSIPFMELAKHRRREKCIQIKNTLQNGYNCGKHFTTFCDLSNSHDYEWIDIYFLSKKDPSVFYNAALISSLMDLSDKIEKKAFDEHDALFPDYEDEYSFIKIENSDLYRLERIKKSAHNHECYDWIRSRQLEIAKEVLPSIYENIRLDYSYGYGVGLYATLRHETFTKEDIDAFIEDFWANGEKEYMAERPLAFGKESIAFFTEHFLR